MTFDHYSIRHEEQRAASDADQAEKQAIISGTALLESGVRDDLIAEALEEDTFEPEITGLAGTNPGFERWHRLDLGTETGIGNIMKEIMRRRDFLGDGYPFQLNGNTLSYHPSKSKFYEYCLGISVAPNVTSGDYVQLPRTFERVVTLLVQLYMGLNSRSFHTGWPRDQNAPKKWRETMAELNRLTGEWNWNPEPGYAEESTVGGDGGIDFVVWKCAPDARPGHLFVIGQCACGGDWGGKLDEISLKALEAWFRPLSFLPPVRAFATPFDLSDGNFHVAHKRAGWVLDRIRMTAMAEMVCGDPSYESWIDMLKSMTDLSLRAA